MQKVRKVKIKVSEQKDRLYDSSSKRLDLLMKLMTLFHGRIFNSSFSIYFTSKSLDIGVCRRANGRMFLLPYHILVNLVIDCPEQDHVFSKYAMACPDTHNKS